MEREPGLARNLFASIFILLMIAGSFWIMSPFFAFTHLGHDDCRVHLAIDDKTTKQI